MTKKEFFYESSSGEQTIRAVRYVPKGKAKAVLQISHGMQDFIDRYEDFAEYLCAQGFVVTGNDHLGHGGSVKSKDDWGYFAKNDGNQAVIEDLYKLTILTKSDYPFVPYFMLGHSMGSFYARQYLTEYGYELNGAIIMGTGHEPNFKVKAGMLVCRIIALFKGWRYRSSFVNNMAFGSYNKSFKPARTNVDWLTKNIYIVDKYLAEPRCTFMFTLNGYYNMFKGISRLHDKELLNKIPKRMPILFTSGEKDPVGGFGKEVYAAADSLKNVGCSNVKVKLYPNDRHEILNELDHEKVYGDIYNWLLEVLTKR